jgi:MATE family multidrug resistance protein
MVRLAAPVALAELGWMAMTTVDTIMIGGLGPAAIGAIGVGSSIYYSIAIFGMGLLLGLDTLVSQAHGAGDKADTHHSLAQGVYLALFISMPLTLLFLLIGPVFLWLGVNPEVSRLAAPFVNTLGLGTLPLLLYGAFRRYLQGIGHVRPVMAALISANAINWLFNWLLIYGHWGLPKLGVVGSALSTCLARVYMAAALLFSIWWFERKNEQGFRSILRPPDMRRLLQLMRLGLPAATQILMEIGAFGAAAVLAGRLSAVAMAAHQIALNCAAVSYMVPLGISSAAAVAVGQSIGAGEPAKARRMGYIAVALGCTFMACSAVAFLVIPLPILTIYTTDSGVLATGVTLLAIAALFQLFDGLQTVLTGALRGVGKTTIAMWVNFAGYWLFGLPVGYYLCFSRGYGVAGLWWGLTIALIGISLTLLGAWRKHWQGASALAVIPSNN